MRGVTVEIASRKWALPYECPCCGSQPDAEITVAQRGRRADPDSARTAEFPYCKRCVGHAAQWDSAGVISAGVTVLAIAAGVAAGVIVKWWIGLVAFAAIAALAAVLGQTRRARAKAQCRDSCASPGMAVAYLGWGTGASAFEFVSPTYMARFAEANTKQLVNPSPQLRKLLERYQLARQQVPTPAAAVSAIPPPLTARDWIARIESAEGPVARRNAFVKASEMVHDALERRELVQAAAKAELAPVLDRVAAQTGDAGKLRWLEHAIEEVQRDNIPDELQAAELEMLRARLEEITAGRQAPSPS